MVNLNWQPGMTLESIEEAAIKQAFKFYQGNKSATARALDIAVRTLEAKLEKYELDDVARTKRSSRIQFDRENWLLRQRGLKPIELPDELKTEAELKGETNESDAGAGLGVQSASEAGSEHAVPMSQRKEVQEVSPKHSAGGSSSKRR